MITIDGSQGEGGGQILRSALALSLITQQPFHMVKVRAGRQRPGLMRQHLTAVRAAAQVGCAQVEGDTVGSTELSFRPGAVNAGVYKFTVGTAGSATLVLQTVLPALWTLSSESALELEGGTHNPMAPPFDFLARCYLPLMARMGPNVSAELHSTGFYPAGGGRFSVKVVPSPQLARLELLTRGDVLEQSIRVLSSQLPRHVAGRELEVLKELLDWNANAIRVESVENSPGPGNCIIAEVRCANVTEVLTAFGEKGLRAEMVAQTIADDVKRYLAATVPVGEHLQDQLLLPMSMGKGGTFLTGPLTGHTRSQMELIPRFLPVKFTAEPKGKDQVLFHVEKS